MTCKPTAAVTWCALCRTYVKCGGSTEIYVYVYVKILDPGRFASASGAENCRPAAPNCGEISARPPPAGRLPLAKRT